jgi:amino acid adenylation domain-containing protein
MLTEQLRSQISERKQELLGFLRSSNKAVPFIPPPISRRKISGPAALSFAQERLWFLEQLEPSSTGYNLCRAWRLAGCLNVAALESSLNQILRRHDVLRSAIQFADGRPLQSVQPPVEFKLKIVDLQQTPEADREAELRRRIQETAEHPFDFAAGMFLRAEVLRVTNDEHILVLATHHIVSDAWSMGILSRELWSLYKTYTAGKSSELEELPIQYADFAVWQREWLQGKVLDSQISYWKKQLADLPINNLPSDRSRAPRQTFRGARLSVALPVSLSAAINELSNECGVTPFMTLLAVFQVLLYRYTGEEDIVVGSPIANRSIAELEPLVGFFVNTLVLRTDLSGNPTFKELLCRVREVCLAAYEHQDLPFEKLVQELQPERDQSRNPLFQVMFVLQNATRGISPLEGMRIEPIEFETGRSLFDLSLYLRERDGKFIGHFEYSTDLFDSSTIQRMTGHLQTLLKAIVTDRDQRISTLPLLTEAERHQLLIEWNDTAAEYPIDKCIHQLFEEQVNRTPRRIAIAFNGQSLTYRELNARANRLAHYLRGIGVGPETLVGICVERSLEMVVGLLGILKAGGAYVPLDPAYPPERVAFILKDARISVLLIQEGLIEDGISKTEDSDRPSLILAPQMKVVCLDSIWETIGGESEQNLLSQVKPDNLAYVIYTSGSTGRPKGVAMAHRSLQNLISWQLGSFTTPKAARTLQFTSLSFDVSFQEMFATWCSGGTLLLISEETRRDTAMLMRQLQNHSIERLFLPFLVLQQFAELADREKVNFTSLREIITAGEQLQITPKIRELFKKLDGCRLHNQYGPTETHVVTSFILEDSPNKWVSHTPIGRPIANTQIYVVDSRLQPVPIGVPGELCIGGAGLARGYLNLLELSAERFFPNPFVCEPQARIYRSGDLVRYLPNGNVEFLGRVDSQVKIRGYRVELDEIEAVLSQHPTVKNCIVVVRERELSAEKSLVSYFVPCQQPATLAIELRSYLAEKLPEYMVPSVFVALDALPLLPNGKVDRQNLPPPKDSRLQVTPGFAPRTEIEELITQMWREVLKLENVGIHDDFFELGGHSLLATQVASRLRDALDREIPVSLLFGAPNVADLSAEIEKLLRDREDPKLPLITPVPRAGPMPLSLNQEQLWRLNQIIPDTHFFNMPYVYQLSGELNIDALGRALKEIIGRHEALRTVFGDLGGRPVQIVKDIIDVEFPVVELRGMIRHDLTKETTSLILEERLAAFDLAVGPLIRSKLLRLTDTENLLLITAHHIVADQWSMQVFRRELITLYEAFCHRKSSPLPEPSIHFADYAYWERRSLDAGLLDDQLTYWKDQLAGVVTEARDQASRDSGGEASFQFTRQSIEINKRLLSKLRLLAKKEDSTVFVLLLTTLIATIYGATGQGDIRIGTLIANRRHRETETTIGPFVNTVILSTHVSPQFTFRQLLGHVKAITLQMHMYQEFPVEQLMREFESKFGIDRSSLFRLLFAYQKRDFEPVNSAGLRFAAWDIPARKADFETLPTTFDLIFDMKETATMLTGTVNVRIAGINGSGAAEVANGFNRILKIIVSESDLLLPTTEA